MLRHFLLAACAATSMIGTASQAHVVLAQTEAAPGSTFVAAFRVSHACGDSPTVRLRVEIPEIIEGVNPQPKAGWKVTIERAPVPAGTKAIGRISAITWEGSLDASFFDDFTALFKLPDSAAQIYFPTVQVCASGEDRQWVQIPAAGKAWNSVPRPAPVLNVTAPTPAAGAEHAHH
jgi:periplasmic copper chaperone A